MDAHIRLAMRLMKMGAVDWEKAVDKTSTRDRDDVRRYLEGMAERAAALLAGYIDERHGYGRGDQGHKAAVKRANRNGKMVWMHVFGYNAYHDLTI
jgi:hypothetical protein